MRRATVAHQTRKRNSGVSEPLVVISVWFVAMVNTFLLVTGALLVGDALHGALVAGQYSVTSPAAVVRFV